MSVRPAKTQISLGIRPVWSESSLCVQWTAKDPRFLHADSEDCDQTGRMPRLIWVFAKRTLSLLVLSCRGSFVTDSCLVGPWTNIILINSRDTVIFLSFRTDRSGQTVQTQIRLLLWVYTVCNSLCIFWMHYSKEKPSCSTFRVITANFRVSEILGFLFRISQMYFYSSGQKRRIRSRWTSWRGSSAASDIRELCHRFTC